MSASVAIAAQLPWLSMTPSEHLFNKLSIATSALLVVALFAWFILLRQRSEIQIPATTVWTTGVAVLFTAAAVVTKLWADSRAEMRRQARIASIEEKAVQHPEKPQLAWDLARVKLENYLDRNLSQVKWIFMLTLVVMGSGFAFILFGLFRAFDEPAKLNVAIVASASGVIISFIGGSFLIIYRSILASAKDYVTVLERINAVGMAVQVIANIPDANSDLKQNATADLANQLLSLYASRANEIAKPRNKRSKPSSWAD